MKKALGGLLTIVIVFSFITEIYFHGTGKTFSLELYLERASQITEPPNLSNFETIWSTELHPNTDNRIGDAIMNAPVINDIWQVMMKAKASVMLAASYITWYYYTQNLLNPIFAITQDDTVNPWTDEKTPIYTEPEDTGGGGEWLKC